MLLLLYFFQSAVQVKNEEIPYSQFQQYLQADQIDQCLIKEKVIVGTLKLTDEKTGKPRHFITVPLRDPDLVQALDKHGVKYRVAIQSHFLSNLLFAWIIPFAVIFLLWGYLGRKMGSAGMNFLNIGKNKAHIHADNLPKVTFEDAAGVDEAKQELMEVVEAKKGGKLKEAINELYRATLGRLRETLKRFRLSSEEEFKLATSALKNILEGKELSPDQEAMARKLVELEILFYDPLSGKIKPQTKLMERAMKEVILQESQ